MPTVTVRRVLEYDIEVPEDVPDPDVQAAEEEARVCSTAEADRERFEVILSNSDQS